MKKILSMAIFLAAGSLCCPGQENVNSPSATEFVRYERIPVSYFNGLPSIEIPIYTAETKDLHLPISLSYHASGIKVNQYPTAVGLGWALNAGGGITRIVNGIPDETCVRDMTDLNESNTPRDPGYYFSSDIFMNDNWNKEEGFNRIYTNSYLDTEPDEFVINAYGLSGSIYFYRDKDGNILSKIKSSNGESFKVEIPVMIHNPEEITFPGGLSGQSLKAYRIYELFYEFTVIKNDGTRLIFGGDPDCIEFYTEKRTKTKSPGQYMKTWPSAWMLREIISPKGNKITFTYLRNGSPIVISDVITDIGIYDANGQNGYVSRQDKSFVVQHPAYISNINVDDKMDISFSMSRDNGLSTVREEDEHYLMYEGFPTNMIDHVCYEEENNTTKIAYSPHNYAQALTTIQIYNDGKLLESAGFAYTSGSNERLKLKTVAIRGIDGKAEQVYRFEYDPLKLPAYNSTVTDNWGYWNNKDYRDTDIEDDFFGYRSASLEHTMAETLTGIT